MGTINNFSPGAKVFMVEDERLIAEELHERLTRMGFEVIGNADTAIGRDLEIPVIYLAAHSYRPTLNRATENAPYGYVLKPFQEEDLLVAIETAIQSSTQERRLKESEARYASTLASIGDGVVATDESGRVTFMNPAAEDLAGWTFSQAQGQEIESVLKFVDEAANTPGEHPIRQALRHRKTILSSNAKLMTGEDGDAIPVDNNASPILTPDGVVIGAVIAFRDLRGRRATENALRKAEEQLCRSQKMDSIGRLAGGVAHDFNNLLTIINGCANLALNNKELNESTRDLLKDIENAGERAATLTNQLLAFSRKQLLAPVVLNLNAVLKNMESMLRRVIREDIEFTLSLSPSPGYVSADPGQFEQVIMNLVVNAREAMTRGGKLTIATANITVSESGVPECLPIKPGRYVACTVTDTGNGMNEHTKAHIFEPFFTTKETKKGTGLGLATVHGIVAQSGGGIWADSEPGQGTKFYVYLPLIAGPVSSESTSRPSAARRGSETILIVEDEDGVRNVLASMLERFGYKVLSSRSGRGAIEICANADVPIHLLLTDVVMPEMGGLQLAARARALRPGIPVLFLSGYLDDAVLRHGMLEDRNAFLQKPIAPNALALKVRQVLDSSA